jgi:hypothetical protein
VCLTETWLLEGIYDGELFDSRYNIYRCDRDYKTHGSSMGGGVLIAVKRKFSIESSSTVSIENAAGEMIKVSVNMSNRRNSSCCMLHIYCGYFPHCRFHCDAMISAFEFISSDFLSHPDDQYLLLGDFNISSANWEYIDSYMRLALRDIGSSLMHTLVSFLNFTGFKQFNTVPNAGGRYLDLVISSCDCLVSHSYSPLVAEDSHHPALLISVLRAGLSSMKPSPQRVRLFRLADYAVINNDLADINWFDQLNDLSIDDAVSEFYQILEHVILRHVPTKNIKNDNRYPCWYSKSLIKIISEKLKFHKKWKLYGRLNDYNTFKMLRERQKHSQLTCYDIFIRNSEQKIKLNSKHFWSFVKSKKASGDLPGTMYSAAHSSSNGQEISNMFNDYFRSVFNTDLSNNGGVTDYGPDALMKSSAYNVAIGSVDISKTEVEKYLRNLDPSKGYGPDGLPPILLKLCFKQLAFPIWLLFKKSLESGCVPSVWKRCFVVPILKSGDKHDITNYRPISKLCSIAKLFEKIIYDKIFPLLRPFVIDQQHGFVSRRSTETNLNEFVHRIATAMDQGFQIDVIYTDYSKAFDKISHSLLVQKLYEIGIHGDLLRWLSSYLRERSQAVTIKGFCSSFVPVTSGVPQGSHLGPLLFNLFINDISTTFINSHILLYADDMKIFRIINSALDCVSLQKDLDRLCLYCAFNELYLNVKKCNVITFSRKPKPIVCNYTLDNVTLERVSVIRDLGIHLDNKLSFNSHINIITARAYKMLGFVLRISKDFRCGSTMLILYNSYVRSLLEYGSTIWNPFYNKYVDMIERIQNKFLKHLNYKLQKENSSIPLDTPSLSLRRIERDQVFLFKILNNIIDSPYLLSQIMLRCPRLSSRGRPLFGLPLVSTNYAMNVFTSRSCRVYNQNFLELDIFNSALKCFRKSISEALKNGCCD